MTHHRFHTLDALRGVAAIAVCALHWHDLFGRNLFANAPLAVDFFFMLSGFVLSLAYQRRLDEGWSTRAFLKARLTRLYPIYALGLIAGFLIVYKLGASSGFTGSRLWTALIFGLLFLPLPPALSGISVLFPMNIPTWSLFIELVANLFHALFLRRRGWVFLGGTIALSGGILLWLGFRVQTDIIGLPATRIWLEIPRVIFSYTVGVALFRMWRMDRVHWRVSPLLLVLMLGGLLAVPLEGAHGLIYDFLVVTCIFPVMVFIGASSNPSERWLGVADLLGGISYPLYVMHTPILGYFQAVWKRVFRQDVLQDTPWSGVACLLMLILVAALLNRFYDIPLREFLQRRVARRKAQVQG
jgi:peptidoglycan/LPS O-acetylase OafA/YrhL